MSDDYPLTPYTRKMRAIKDKRDQEMFEIYQSGEHTMKEIGEKFSVSATTVNAAVHKILRRQRGAAKL